MAETGEQRGERESEHEEFGEHVSEVGETEDIDKEAGNLCVRFL